MKIKQLTMSAILLAIGAILHYIVPGIFGGMKPDFLLSMMFLAILINFNATNIAATSIACGIISALTTTFPAGQIPNIIDKCITGAIIGFLIYGLNKVSIPKILKAVIIGLVGTLISGTIFLGSAYLLVGLPEGASFGGLFIAVVIPATIGNVVFTTLLYQVIERAGLNKVTLSE
ncbi:tryptophan transporter [Defluviitalea phaphyphila]|uniref:tryptophan transporter n=1 Tax=Defluviitalea phaphyphila TaxID=1473580 RepID=UPI0007303057|nr:tryptophan transporter [Defluviitalea phaphyphila]